MNRQVFALAVVGAMMGHLAAAAAAVAAALQSAFHRVLASIDPCWAWREGYVCVFFLSMSTCVRLHRLQS